MDMTLHGVDGRIVATYASGLPPAWNIGETHLKLERRRNEHCQVSMEMEPLRDATNMPIASGGDNRNVATVWDGLDPKIRLIRWLAAPFPVVSTVWSDGQLAAMHAATGKGNELLEATQRSIATHGPVAPTSSLRGVNGKRLHGSGLSLHLTGTDQLLLIGHVHMDSRPRVFKWGTTYVHYFILVEAAPPFTFLKQSPPFCLPSTSNSSICESIQFMSSMIMEGSDVQFTYGINDCGGGSFVMSVESILSFAESSGSVSGRSELEVAKVFGAAGPDGADATRRCAIASSAVQSVTRRPPDNDTLHERIYRDLDGHTVCKCAESFRCVGQRCIPNDAVSSLVSDATSDSFPANCGDACGCFLTPKGPAPAPCGAFNCSCQGFSDRYMASPSDYTRKAPANTHWFWELLNCSSTPRAAAESGHLPSTALVVAGWTGRSVHARGLPMVPLPEGDSTWCAKEAARRSPSFMNWAARAQATQASPVIDKLIQRADRVAAAFLNGALLMPRDPERIPKVIFQLWRSRLHVPHATFWQAARYAPGYTHIILSDAEGDAWVRATYRCYDPISIKYFDLVAPHRCVPTVMLSHFLILAVALALSASSPSTSNCGPHDHTPCTMLRLPSHHHPQLTSTHGVRCMKVQVRPRK